MERYEGQAAMDVPKLRNYTPTQPEPPRSGVATELSTLGIAIEQLERAAQTLMVRLEQAGILIAVPPEGQGVMKDTSGNMCGFAEMIRSQRRQIEAIGAALANTRDRLDI